MTNDQIRMQIDAIGIIPAVRAGTAENAQFAAETIGLAGIPIIELTMTIPGATRVIERIRREHPGIVVGAGTVFDVATAKRCLDAGAMFLTSPGLAPEVVEFARRNGLVSIPGALTPTEVHLAHETGADYVKIFPCSHVGGPNYIRALKRPFPNVRLIASGGVNQHNVDDFIRAGAHALGIGEHLIAAEALRERKADWIEELAGRYLRMVKRARELRDAPVA